MGENRKLKTKNKEKRKGEVIEYVMNLSQQSSSTDFLYDSKENDNLLKIMKSISSIQQLTMMMMTCHANITMFKMALNLFEKNIT